MGARVAGVATTPTATRKRTIGHLAGRHRLVVLVVLALLAWSALNVGLPAAVPDSAGRLGTLSRVGAAALFIVGGATQLVRARITGSARLRWSAAALLLAGGGMVLAGSLSGLAGDAAASRPEELALVRLLVVAPVLAVLLIGTGPRAGRLASRALLVVSLILACEALIGVALSDARITGMVTGAALRPLWLGVAVGASTVLAGVALRLVMHAYANPGRLLGWRAGAVALMTANQALFTAGLAGVRTAGAVAPGFELLAAGTVTAMAGLGLRAALADNSRTMLELDEQLRLAQGRLQLAQRDERSRLHDARTAMVGVLGAAELLAAGQDDGPSGELRRMVSAELHRMITVLDPEVDDRPCRFALAQVLEPVLLAHRARGMTLSVDLRELSAFGRPALTATVVANLLDNAAKHAPGAAVSVRALSAGARVRLCVEDDGPGIPREQREFVLRRGARSPGVAVPGSGIGLHSAVQAMAAQGGTLRVEGRTDGRHGTRIVLTMPAARIARPLPVRPAGSRARAS